MDETPKSETLEKIAELIAHLPSDELYNPDIMTPDQKAEWEKIRKVQQLLAEEWRSRYLSEPGSYPIEEARDLGEITKAQASLLLSKFNEHQRRWELCQVAEPLLREKHKIFQAYTRSPQYQTLPPHPMLDQSFWRKFEREYPFKSDVDLFIHTLREEADYNFSCCFEPYHEMPTKKWRKTLHYIQELLEVDSQLPEMTIKDWKKIKKNLPWEKTTWDWWMVTLFISQFYASENPVVKARLITYLDSYREVLQRAKSASRKIPSTAWKEGKLLHGTKQGGVYQ